ncbi:hypothetical protein [Roseomonas indoligenes]|uniref:Uncharacterized protein n=1 Tax=Roseomonas indoligenes TaxID=2820811 RepID=A0A940N0R7_9PROT|nr:hypothetical protein [Pararoseomonas indoligenes]MBP0494409.1 hypothetical protein [Pararoseomonas indoligenes]
MSALARTIPLVMAVLAFSLLVPSEAEAGRRGRSWGPEAAIASIFGLRLSAPAPRYAAPRRARRAAPARGNPAPPPSEAPVLAAASPRSASPAPPAPVAAQPLPPASPTPALAAAAPQAAPAAPAALLQPAASTSATARTPERSRWVDPVR